MRLNDHKNTSTDYRIAKKLRNEASSVEKKLWVALRENAAAKGFKFRRQHVVHPYIADFACLKARLLIELDGSSHDARQIYDMVRDQFLSNESYTILRFSNDDIMKNTLGVVEVILTQTERLLNNNRLCAKRNAPLPCPPRVGEGTRPVQAES